MTYQTPFSAKTPLSALTKGSILQIPTSEIYANNAKLTAKNSKTVRMVQSIKKYGLSTPIVVTPTEVFPGILRYLVVEGEETWQAACLAGIEQIPCLIAQNAPKEAEIASFFAQIAEKEANMFEQAEFFRTLTANYALTQEEISRRAGISQSAVANKLRLLHLSDAERQKILHYGLSERHARALLRLRSPSERSTVLETVCQKRLSVAATEALIENYTPKSASAPDFTAIQHISPLKRHCESRKNEKFVLHTLQPLYNSLERTLSIFRKTGREASLESIQTEEGILITIKIPQA